MQISLIRFTSPRLPPVIIYAVPGWPPGAFAALDNEIVLVSQASTRGATLIRCRRALRRLGIL